MYNMRVFISKDYEIKTNDNLCYDLLFDIVKKSILDNIGIIFGKMTIKVTIYFDLYFGLISRKAVIYSLFKEDISIINKKSRRI